MSTWTISTMDRNVSDGGVTQVYWRVVDSETVGDVTYAASSYGSFSCTPDPSSEDFIAYADLTEDVVLGWVHAEVDQVEVEARLAADIAEQKTPVTEVGVPW